MASSSIDSLLSEAIQASRAGDKARSLELLVQVLQADKRNESAWLWMSAAVATRGEQRFCLERVLELNPQNVAVKRGIESIGDQYEAIVPQALRPKAASPEAATPTPHLSLQRLLSRKLSQPSKTWCAVATRAVTQWFPILTIRSVMSIGKRLSRPNNRPNSSPPSNNNNRVRKVPC